MNNEVTVAVLRLQDSLMSGRLTSWRAEQTEEALNGLLAKPHRTGDPFHLERNAMSDSRKKLQRRATLFADHLGEIEVMADGGTPGEEVGREPYEILRADIVDTVQRTSSGTDREIFAVALEGGTAADVAEALAIDYDIAKVRLSRARQRVRAVWGNA